jgi:hypothetical protein
MYYYGIFLENGEKTYETSGKPETWQRFELATSAIKVHRVTVAPTCPAVQMMQANMKVAQLEERSHTSDIETPLIEGPTLNPYKTMGMCIGLCISILNLVEGKTEHKSF